MTFAAASYGAAAVAYGLLAGMLVFNRQSHGEGRWLVAAVIGTALWGAAIGTIVALGGAPSPLAMAADALRSLLWTLCLLRALPDLGWRGTHRILSVGAVVVGVPAVSLPFLLGGTSAATALLSASILGCLAVEQIVRNSTVEQKRVLKPFLYAMVVIFGYDLFVFSDGVLVQGVDTNLWAARGLLAALAVPFILITAKRHADWVRTLFISRQVVFYSTTLTGVGLYFIAMAIAGVTIRERSGEWGGWIQLVFFAAAFVVLALVLSSARLRSAGRMFITKHFYRHQYEYRDEWLRLIRTLSAPTDDLPIAQRSIKALADIIDSPGGQIWLNTRNGVYEPFASWGDEFPTQELAPDAALVRFLRDQQWVIDSDEYERDPELYSHAFRESPSQLPARSIVTPLFLQNELLGFARLVRPHKLRKLNYEDHDLLKTAGRQVAAFLAHDLAMEQLTETRQFEAFSKLSAFVMHDLKNLLSQQALLVENAAKYQHRPEFVADVVKTVDSGVQRMRKLLLQLERKSGQGQEQRVELNALVQETIAGLAKKTDVRASFVRHRPLWVQVQPDRFASVLAHVIVNAQEASSADDTVEVRVTESDGRAVVEVHDRGAGMTEEFVRRRLFKPFDTTKGSSGMGIGVYQAREVVRSFGGDIAVKSAVGSGTLVSIYLPLAQPMDRQASGLIG